MGWLDGLWNRWRGMLVIVALFLTALNGWCYVRMNSARNVLSAYGEYHDFLMKREDNVVKAIQLWKVDRGFPESDEQFYSDTWPSLVFLGNEECVMLHSMGIGPSATYCFNDKTGKLTRKYIRRHG